MQTIRVDIGKDYHTQRNNLVRPSLTCASTSMAMALNYSGYQPLLDKVVPKGTQEEDFITNFIHTDSRVIDFWSKHSEKWIRDAYLGYTEFTQNKRTAATTTFGNEIHPVMEFAINTMFGKPIDKFGYSVSMKKILFNLLKGGAVVTSGSWPHSNGKPIAHVVCLVGFKTTQENILTATSPDNIDHLQAAEFIIDDPYGDYRQLYKITAGNDVIVSRADFIKIINESGVVESKRAHLITPLV